MERRSIRLETVGDLLAAGRERGAYYIYGHCLECHHSTELDLEKIAARKGLYYRIDRLKRSLRCSRCQSSQTTIRIGWKLPD